MSIALEDLVPNAVQSFEFHGSDGGDSSLPSLEPFEFHLEESLSKPYKLDLRLAARDPSIDESALVGQACTLTLTRGGLVRHINGIVLDATFSGIALDTMTPEGNLPTGAVDLTVVPALELLRQRRNNRIFQKAKVPDILKEVLEEALGDYGRTVKMETTKEYDELEYCTQFDETDFDFVQRLMATEGIMSYFKQGETAEELILFDTADKYLQLVTMDHGKVPFETHFQAEHVVETVTRFRLDTRLTSTTVTARAFNWSKAETPDETSAPGEDSLSREREWYLGEAPVGLRALDGNGTYAKTSADGQTKLIRETALSRTRIASGDGDVTGLSPGVTFDLDNALRDELNRKYLVIQVSHHGVRPGNSRKGTFAAEVGEVTYTNTFKCVASDVLYRLATPPRRFVQTMQTATVVGDEDISTDVHGRIKVQFHWARVDASTAKKGKSDIKSSCWVRVAQSSAGIGFGHVFIPRKGQEVVVTFLEGDPDKPLVIGSVYNAINKTPYELDAQKTRSVIRTRSTPNSDGYNEISFEDNSDKEQLYIQAQKDMKELVKNNHDVHIQNDESYSVDQNQTLTVGGKRTHTVKKDEAITIEGNQSIIIQGKGQSPVHSTVTVTGKHTFDASDTIKIQAPTSITLQCGGSTIVMEPKKITLTAGDGAVLVLDANLESTAKPGGHFKIDADLEGSSANGGGFKVDANVAAQSAKASQLKLDGDAALSGSMKASVSGTTEATMSAAPGSVKASPAGVEVSGPKVDVAGTAMVTVSAALTKVG